MVGSLGKLFEQQERRLAAGKSPKDQDKGRNRRRSPPKCFLCTDKHWLKDCPYKKFSEGCFVCGSKDHMARDCFKLAALRGRSSDSPRAPKVELIPFGRDNGLFLFADLTSDQQRLGPLRCLVDTGCCSTMVAKKVLPKGVTIRPVVGPALMTIDRSICKIVGVVSLTVEVYDCDNARQGIHPGEDEPRIPFPVSALVVDSLAYDVILGHDFLNHFELDIRYSESPTRIVGRWPPDKAPRIPWFTEHPVQAANLTSKFQVYASSARIPEYGGEPLNDSFDLSCPEYLPAGAGKKVDVVPLTDDELREKGLPVMKDALSRIPSARSVESPAGNDDEGDEFFGPAAAVSVVPSPSVTSSARTTKGVPRGRVLIVRRLAPTVDYSSDPLIDFDEDGLLVRKVHSNGRIYYVPVVPPRLRDAVLFETHENHGHQGLRRANQFLQERFYWSGMSEHLYGHIGCCSACYPDSSDGTPATLSSEADDVSALSAMMAMPVSSLPRSPPTSSSARSVISANLVTACEQWSKQELAQKQDEDDVLVIVKARLREEEPFSRRDIQNVDFRPYRRLWSVLFLDEEGLLVRMVKQLPEDDKAYVPVIPTALRHDVLYRFHDRGGHFGRNHVVCLSLCPLPDQ
ncbi:hypothetical protein FOZ62_004301 [Perkinsus olseni]|uniref:CCHC-type domain-containing protein n=1 Tax=Perkinsus olseni TaxID=32597 RepID=A0A7J6U0C5_PEROL|nr:hypothetical protein FOZ62_004301 [Perkinsus olseni]